MSAEEREAEVDSAEEGVEEVREEEEDIRAQDPCMARAVAMEAAGGSEEVTAEEEVTAREVERVAAGERVAAVWEVAAVARHRDRRVSAVHHRWRPNGGGCRRLVHRQKSGARLGPRRRDNFWNRRSSPRHTRWHMPRCT